MPTLRLPRGRRTRLIIASVGIIATLIIADAVALSARLDEVEVVMPDVDDDLDTWLIVGSDSRAAIPDTATQDQFGSTEEVPGARADLILLLVESAEGTRLLSIPRDMLASVDGFPMRLGMTLLDGAQNLTDALCSSFGVAVDHYLQLDFAGFADIVDTVGGIEVDIEYPIRDPLAGLDIPNAGAQQIDGATALALVRSRAAEELIGDTWIPSSQGADDRASWGAVVLSALASAASARWWNPVAMQRLAWSLTGALTVDSDTGLVDLAGLDTDFSEVSELPHDPPQILAQPGQAVPLPPNDETAAMIADLGFVGECQAA